MKKVSRLSFVRNLSTESSSSSSSFGIKNVTTSNFEETLTTLRTLVKAADFVAVDLEMSGITSCPWREPSEFDRYDVRYLKVKDSVQNFALLQFGVCPFRWDPLRRTFLAHPHNFYIFPRPELPADFPAHEFLCQTSSIDFLAKYKFDFNACIHKGVSYLSRGQEDMALSRLHSVYSEKWHHHEGVQDVPLVNVADILYSERMKIRLTEWHDSLLQSRNTRYQFHENTAKAKQSFETLFYSMRPAVKLTGLTSHQLKLIELVTRKYFDDLIFISAYDEDSILQKLIVYVESEDDRAKLMKEVKDGHHTISRRKVEAAVGFRHVIDLLSAERKLIVGHNCFLDMAHIYHKFFGPLPSTVEEFVSNLHNSFPHIVDTKILLNMDNVLHHLMKKGSTSLSSAYSKMCPEIDFRGSTAPGGNPLVKVEVQVDDMRSSNWNSGAKHEAGYDAFMTGCVFVQSCSHLGVDFSAENPVISEKLKKYANLLYLSWNSGDVINISTGSINELPVANSAKRKFKEILYSRVVLIWGYPSKLKAHEIKQCLSKVFGGKSVASIYNLDETAVFVQFSKKELVAAFFALKERLEANDDAVSVLHPLSKLLEGGKTCAAAYETYKDICCSPGSKVLFAEQAEAVGISGNTNLLDLDEKPIDEEPDNLGLEESTWLTSQSRNEIDRIAKGKPNIQNSALKENTFFNKFLYGSDSETGSSDLNGKPDNSGVEEFIRSINETGRKAKLKKDAQDSASKRICFNKLMYGSDSGTNSSDQNGAPDNLGLEQ